MKRTELLNAVTKVMPGVETGELTISGLDHIVFSDGKLMSYNDTLGVSYPMKALDKKISAAVAGKELHAILQRLVGEEIEISDTKKTLVLKSGAAVVELSKIEIDLEQTAISMGLDITPDMQWGETASNFIEGLMFTFLEKNIRFPDLFIDGTDIYCTDGRRMSRFTMDDDMGVFRIGADEKVIRELGKMGGIFTEYAVTDHWLHLKTDFGAVWSYRLVPLGDWEQKKRIYDKTFKENEKNEKDFGGVLDKRLIAVINRASVVKGELSGWEVVNMDFEIDKVAITSENAIGKFKEVLESPDFEGVPETVVFPIGAEVFLKKLPENSLFHVKTHPKSKIMVHTGDNFVYLSVMVFEVKSAPEIEKAE